MEGAAGRREQRVAVMGPERETLEELPFRGEWWSPALLGKVEMLTKSRREGWRRPGSPAPLRGVSWSSCRGCRQRTESQGNLLSEAGKVGTCQQVSQKVWTRTEGRLTQSQGA